jgi:WhiB family transcriptional regulator, redox-sensing transcriptional regulator
MNVAGNLSLGVPKLQTVPTRDWARDAACVGYDPNLWFLEDKTGSYRDARIICAACPVRLDCLDWALETNTDYGLWGGLAPHERRRLRRSDRHG